MRGGWNGKDSSSRCIRRQLRLTERNPLPNSIFSRLIIGLICAYTGFGCAETAPPPCACPAGTPVSMVGEKKIEDGPGMRQCSLETFKLHSPAMTRDIEVGVLLPPAYAKNPNQRFPVLYAMHGMSAPYLTWTTMFPLLQAITEKPMIVVVFNGDRDSCFFDATKRPRSLFTTFFFKELVPFLDHAYRIDPKLRGATGFSMGGLGALHYMLTRPDFFVGVSSISEALYWPNEGDQWPGKGLRGKPSHVVVALLGAYEENKAEYERVSLLDRFETARINKTKLPPLYFPCGTEDEDINAVRNARDVLSANPQITLEYQESPGKHEYKYWRDTSPAMIDFHWRTFQSTYSPKNIYHSPDPGKAP